MAKTKNAAAVELGRRGGQKKVPKGFAMMTPEKKAEVLRKSLKARRAKKAKAK
jgi:hypothetical protein